MVTVGKRVNSAPSAQIAACAANVPGSSLGFCRRSGDRALDVGSRSAGRIDPLTSGFDAVDGSHPPVSRCQNAFDVAELFESAYGYERTLQRSRLTSVVGQQRSFGSTTKKVRS